MKRLFNAQKYASVLYIIITLVVFVYAVTFMTAYSDLAGLKRIENRLVSNFYQIGLQTFNRAILICALAAVVGIVLIFFLEIGTRVPDRFAVIVMTVLMALCCYGAWFGISNIMELAAYYGRLSFAALPLEGGAADYQLKLATLQAGIYIYIAQMVICAGFAGILIASHVKFTKLQKEGRS